jgi:hypothetical protein
MTCLAHKLPEWLGNRWRGPCLSKSKRKALGSISRLNLQSKIILVPFSASPPIARSLNQMTAKYQQLLGWRRRLVLARCPHICACRRLASQRNLNSSRLFRRYSRARNRGSSTRCLTGRLEQSLD